MAGVLAARAPAAQAPLAFVQAIELPHVEGRIDHLAFDERSGRLFVAALGNNTIEVLDTRQQAHVKTIAGAREPQGIAVAADADVVAVANGAGDGVQLFAGADLRPTLAVRLGDDADNVRYDARAKRLYVGYGGGALAAVDPVSGRVAAEAKLAGHPESFQLEQSGARMFVNVPTADQIAVVDRTSMKVTATWPVSGAKSNFPMALDEADHRVIVGCRRPARALLFDTAAGRETGAFPIVGDTDDLFFDSPSGRLYVSGGEGFVDVFRREAPDRFVRVAHVATAAGARTSLWVAAQHRLYVAVPHRGSQRAEIRVFEAR